MDSNTTAVLVSVEQALIHIHEINISPLDASKLLALGPGDTKAVLGWMFVLTANIVADVGMGLYAFQTGCSVLASIPGWGTVTGAACIVATISSMLLVAGFTTGISYVMTAIFDSSGVQVSTRANIVGTQVDFSDYYGLDRWGHHANLTAFHTGWRQAGFKTDIVLDNNSSFYLIDGSLFGTNVTNVYQSPSGHNIYAQHGLAASRIFLPYFYKSEIQNKFSKHSWEPADPVDEYGNGFNDEELANGWGFKGQYCHSLGSSEEISFQYDWSTMNDLVHDATGETQGFGDNAEWSEEELCDYPSS